MRSTVSRRGALLGGAALGISAASARARQATPVAGWESSTPLPVGRSEFAGTVLDGKIYVAGGFGAETRFDRFDPATGEWEELAPLPEPRHHLGLTASSEAVFLAGGHNQAENRAQANFWRYLPAENAWSELEPLPQGPRGALGAAVLDGAVYVCGGSSVDLGGPATADLARYDLTTASWQQLAPMPTAREHLGVAAIGGKLVAIGGRNGSHETHALLAANEIYDPASDSWAIAAELPEPRAGLGVASDGDRVYILGGERFTSDEGARVVETFAAVSVYDIAVDSWSALPDLPVARHGMAAALVAGALYGIGGSTVAGTVANTDRVDRIKR